jgi:hypothetical protein
LRIEGLNPGLSPQRQSCRTFSLPQVLLAPVLERVVLQILRTKLVDTTTLNGTPPLRDYLIAR